MAWGDGPGWKEKFLSPLNIFSGTIPNLLIELLWPTNANAFYIYIFIIYNTFLSIFRKTFWPSFGTGHMAFFCGSFPSNLAAIGRLFAVVCFPTPAQDRKGGALHSVISGNLSLCSPKFNAEKWAFLAHDSSQSPDDISNSSEELHCKGTDKMNPIQLCQLCF